MNKAYKYRIYPTLEQQVLLRKTFGCVRFIYNKMLADKIKYYESDNKMLYNYPSQYKSEFPWLKEVDSLALVGAQNALGAAYSNFFRAPKIGFPKFKSRHTSKKSYTTNNQKGSIKILDASHVKLPILGSLRIKLHRQIPDSYRIKSATVSQESTGKYYISILTEYENNVTPIVPANVVGLDFSMKELYVDSERNEANYPRFYRNTQEKLAKEQRILSKRKKGSGRYLKQKQRVAQLHAHIANQRKDFLHKLSTVITKQYDTVAIESLNMRSMAQTLHFGKSITDNGWGMFTNMLDYKLKEQGKALVKIDKWFPSTKLCSNCGCKKVEMKLQERTYFCEHCDHILDRDLNAATNIKNVGRVMLGLKVESSTVKELSKKNRRIDGVSARMLGRKRPSNAKLPLQGNPKW